MPSHRYRLANRLNIYLAKAHDQRLARVRRWVARFPGVEMTRVKYETFVVIASK